MSVGALSGHTALNGDGEDPIHREEGRDGTDVSIRVKGHLDPCWCEWLEGLRIAHEPDGTSTLNGPLQDQPALYGVLTKLSHLGVTLLAVESREPPHNKGS